MTTEHGCVVCPVLYPAAPVRFYERPQSCEPCRDRLRHLLAEIVDVYAELSLEKLRGHSQRVSGTRTPPIPLNVDTLDLTMPGRSTDTGVPDLLLPQYVRAETTVGVWQPASPDGEYELAEITVSQKVRKRDDRGYLAWGPSGDQIGALPILVRLDTWARDWQTFNGALLPPATVTSLSGWLTLWLDWACDHHPAIDDFADELRSMVGHCRDAAGLTPERPELIDIPCRRPSCDQLSLYRNPGDDRVYCGNPDCLAVYTGKEYREWCELLAAWPVVAA